ncbi:MAG: hypothetical protein JF924_12560 [Candidatus Dormibacteraeota bacterium]|nr:hypothetical protein [Candidatus Dormibacteraeota bacterium]
MSAEATQLPCPRCGKPRAEWTEHGGDGVTRAEVTYCSEACAETDARPEAFDQGDTRISGGPEPGPAAGPEAAGSPAAAPSSPEIEDPRAGGPRP